MCLCFYSCCVLCVFMCVMVFIVILCMFKTVCFYYLSKTKNIYILCFWLLLCFMLFVFLFVLLCYVMFVLFCVLLLCVFKMICSPKRVQQSHFFWTKQRANHVSNINYLGCPNKAGSRPRTLQKTSDTYKFSEYLFLNVEFVFLQYG